MTAAPVPRRGLAGVDLVLASHKHSDHLDPGTVPGHPGGVARARLIVPAGAASITRRALGIEPADGSPGSTRARPSKSRGSASAPSPRPTRGSTRTPTAVIFIWGSSSRPRGSGSITAATASLTTASPAGSAPTRSTSLFLPINGRDPARGVPGNMSAAEAVDLASRVRPRFVVPHHYDMFTFNTVAGGRVRGRGAAAAAGRRRRRSCGAASVGRSEP